MNKQLKSKDIKKFRAFILKTQNGKCLVCGKVPKRACLDHSHTKRIKGTGLIRGVVCSNCNVMIAKSENNSNRYGFNQKELPTILRSIADYLERKHLPFIHPSEAPKPLKLMRSSFNKLKKALEYTKYTCPSMSKSGILTKPLEKAFKIANIEPQFYGEKNERNSSKTDS